MDRDHEGQPPEVPQAALDLVVAVSRLHNSLLDDPEVDELMHVITVLCAALVPSRSCGLLLVRDNRFTSFSSDDFAKRLDEIRYGRGQGPCLAALRTGRRITVADLVDDRRWSVYRGYALSAGLRSAVAFPLALPEYDCSVALSLYSRAPDAFDAEQIRRVEWFAQQVTSTLTLHLRFARQSELERQLHAAMNSRALIDQAMGIMMARHKITSSEAIVVLRQVSQQTNRKLRDVAIDLIETVTGSPHQTPRPFTQRD